MHLRAATVAFLLYAAAAGAEKPVAPLENSKQELKGLQQDQAAAKNGAATGRLTDGLPQYQGPSPGVVPLEMPTSGKSPADLKKKKDAQKNWLADGVNKLEKEAQTKDKRASGDVQTSTDAEEENKSPDATASDSLLKIYDEQQKEVEARNKAKHAAGPANDAFAPFLQDWLGNSPSRGKFFDEFTRRPDSSAGGPAPAGRPPGGLEQFQPPTDLAATTRESVAAKPNPYLQGLDMSAISDQRTNRQATGDFGPAAKPAEIAPPVKPFDPLPAMGPQEKKPLIPPLSDDKKYFPQQKKF